MLVALFLAESRHSKHDEADGKVVHHSPTRHPHWPTRLLRMPSNSRETDHPLSQHRFTSVFMLRVSVPLQSASFVLCKAKSIVGRLGAPSRLFLRLTARIHLLSSSRAGELICFPSCYRGICHADGLPTNPCTGEPRGKAALSARHIPPCAVCTSVFFPSHSFLLCTEE